MEQESKEAEDDQVQDEMAGEIRCDDLDAMRALTDFATTVLRSWGEGEGEGEGGR